MSTVRLTTAQALVAFMRNQFVVADGREQRFFHGVMGIFGHGNVTGIGQALEQLHARGEGGTLPFVQGKSEQGMAHAAIAYAKQRNRSSAYACTSSIGPGALNMVTAAATATVNRIPLLLLPGDVFASRQPDPVLQQIEHSADYTITANDAFKPVSKYWDRINRPEQLMMAMLQAMRVLLDPAETGAVTICLPQDVQCEAYDYPVSFLEKRVHAIDRRPPAETAIARAMAMLRRKQRPVVICGGGVLYAEATEALTGFAEAAGIPVLETQAGKSAMDWRHPLAFGGVGVTGTRAANKLLHEADAVIAIGTRLGDFATESKSAFRHPELELIAINVCRADAVKLGACEVVADAREGIAGLHEAVRAAGYRSAYAAEELERLKQIWQAETERLYDAEHPEGLAQTRALGVINRFVGERDIIVGAAGSLPGDLHRLWRSGVPKSYHLEYGFSCMGYEIAGALGCKLAEPDREVYALVGDGSYLMLHTELVTSLQEGRKITVLLFDNGGFQCIHNLQRAHGSAGFGNEFRRRLPEQAAPQGGFLPLDFAANARSYGIQAYTARDAGQLTAALTAARQETQSVLIDIKVLPGTGTDGYDSWWHVGVAAVADSEAVRAAHTALRGQLERVRQY